MAGRGTVELPDGKACQAFFVRPTGTDPGRYRYMMSCMSDVRDNKSKHRFEMDAGGDSAVAYYTLAPGVITFNHTEVPPTLRGQGIASRLIRGALEAARAQRMKVVPRCSFVAAYLARHSEFNDLLR